MTGERVEGLLRVQRSIAETLELYGRPFDQQREQLQKLQEDVTRVHNLVYKLYVIPYPTKPIARVEDDTSADH